MKKLFAILAFAIIPFVATRAQVIYQNGVSFYIHTGGLVQIKGDAQIQNGSTLTNKGTLAIAGNLLNNHTMAAAGTGTLELNGTTPQTLSGTGLFSAQDVTINNTAGISLNMPLRAEGQVKFTTGVLEALNTASPFTISATGTVNGVSNASHIHGYVVKEGIGSFTYPVGNGSVYQPVTVDLTDNGQGLRARYFSSDANVAAFAATGASQIKLESYNQQEYWDLSPLSTATGKVTITWDATNNGPITASTNVNVFKVAHKKASGWLNEGSSAVTGTGLAGHVTSQTISSWSPFTLGAIPEAALPVTLISFTARLSEDNAVLKWQTSSELNASYFDVERSTDARSFEKIAQIQAAGNSSTIHTYYYTDKQLSRSSPVTYYRLRQVDQDGTYAYSRAISITRNDTRLLASVYPNPAQSETPVTIEAGASIAAIQLLNMSGQKITVPVINIASGKAELNLNGLASGMYLLQLRTAGGTTTKKLIVK